MLAIIALHEMNYPAAEAELTALLDMNHNDAATSLQLGAAIVSEKMPDRYPVAIFHLARRRGHGGPSGFRRKKSREVGRDERLEEISTATTLDLFPDWTEVKRASE